MKIHYLHERWSTIPGWQWTKALHRPGHMQRDLDLVPLLMELYLLFPGPGRPTHAETPIILEHGKGVDWHSHPEHTLIYYINTSPCALLMRDLLGDHRVTPEANTAIYLPPGTEHAVEKNLSMKSRQSVALRWEQTYEK